MIRLSSYTALVTKIIFPYFMFFISVLFALMLLYFFYDDAPYLVLGPLLFMLVAYAIKKNYSKYLDSLYFDEKHILCKRKGQSVSIPMIDVSQVRFGIDASITLKVDCILGKELYFIPRGNYFNPFKVHPSIEDFIKTKNNVLLNKVSNKEQ